MAGIVPAGCAREEAQTQAQAAPEVDVVVVIQRDVPLYSEYVATTAGMVTAKIRAQVSGYLLQRRYNEGAFVKKGDVLFEIDPRPFRAALDKAKGELAKSRAQLEKARLDVERDTPLAKSQAISQKELDDSIQAYESAKASVDVAKATVEQADLNLEWTRITAPIDGVVGIAKAQVGDLVGPADDELATISTLDPIKVYFPISEQRYLEIAQLVQEKYKTLGQPQEDRLELILSNGSVFPNKGHVILADRQVDMKTGTIRIAAVFSNPDNMLRPGQFARVRVLTKTKPGALLVPQRAVKELQGGFQVAVVGGDNKVEVRPVKVGARIDNLWIVEQGLQPGDRVIAEGLLKLKAGMTVSPKPFRLESAAKSN